MKSKVKMFAIAIVAANLIIACTKKNINPESVVNNVTLETSLQPGETYNLDLSAYSAKTTRSSVTKQPAHAVESVLINNTCQSSGSYSYRAGSSATNDQVVLRIIKGDKCDKQEETTNITINVKVEQPRVTEE
ncbi:MAG: hypothetical protein Q8M29_00825 [Bacteroidota bacterium]|nr:hypothetical protein [Bacteroidota bacterium]